MSGAKAAIKSTYKGATELDQKAKMDLINDSALGAFVMGLRGNLEIRVSSRRPENLGSAISYAIEEQRRVDEISEKHGWYSRDVSPTPRTQTPAAFRPGTAENRPYLTARPSNINSQSTSGRSFLPRGNRVESAGLVSDESRRLPLSPICPNCCYDQEQLIFQTPSDMQFEDSGSKDNPVSANCHTLAARVRSDSHLSTPVMSSLTKESSEPLNCLSARSTPRTSTSPIPSSAQEFSNQIRFVKTGAMRKTTATVPK